MKNISPADNEKLLEYLDGTLNATEQAKLEESLQQSVALKNRLEELRQVHVGLKRVSLQEPSKNFTQVVMGKLDQYPAKSGFSMRNSILLLAGVLIAVGIGSLLISMGAFDSSSTIELNDIGLKNKYIDTTTLPSIPFNGKLVVNIIIMLNLALAFIVLDRAILKPWFERRAKMHY